VEKYSSQALENITVFSGYSSFMSLNAPGQWVCWDFQEMRVEPDNYEIYFMPPWMQSWVLEGSVDGRSWKEMDRQTDYARLKNADLASFRVPGRMDCRFIRLTQTDKNVRGDDVLSLFAVEFFGTLAVSTFPEEIESTDDRLNRLETVLSKDVGNRVTALEREAGLHNRYEAWFPLQRPKSFDGMITYRAACRRSVTISASSVERSDPDGEDKWDRLQSLAAPSSSSRGFVTLDKPGQWVCWDFRCWCFYMSHYTLRASHLESWVLEGSRHGERWTEIDRHSYDFEDEEIASFAVANFGIKAYSRIRLTQTSKRYDGCDYRALHAAEFFGAWEPELRVLHV
jgi:hypothetical protein